MSYRLERRECTILEEPYGLVAGVGGAMFMQSHRGAQPAVILLATHASTSTGTNAGLFVPAASQIAGRLFELEMSEASKATIHTYQKHISFHCILSGPFKLPILPLKYVYILLTIHNFTSEGTTIYGTYRVGLNPAISW